MKEEYLIEKAQQSKGSKVAVKKALKGTLKPSEYARALDELREGYAAGVNPQHLCHRCRKSEMQLGNGDTLRCCAQCKSVGRSIKYCSR